MGGAPPIMKLAGSLPLHLAFATLACPACVGDSLPVGMPSGSDGTDAETGDTTEPPETSGWTSSAVPPPTADEGTSETTGDAADLCPGPSGWQWIDVRGTEDDDEKHTKIEVVADGVVVGGTVDPDLEISVLRRYDVSGQLQWEHEGPGGVRFEDMRVLPDGDVVACGFFHQPVPALWLARFDAMGNEVWSVDEPNLNCRTVDVTAAGEIVVGGTLDGHTTDDGETAVLRFDASGTLLRTWTADLPFTFGIMWLVAVGDELVLLTEDGATDGFWLGRLDANDQLAWGQSHFDRDLHLGVFEVAVDAATGDIVVVGFTGTGLIEPNDLAAWRFSGDGTLQWEAVHALTPDSEQAHSVRIAPDGTLVIAGAVQQGGTYQALVAALEPNGALAWWTTAETGSNMIGHDLALDDCGAVYVAGRGSWGQPYDGWVGRYVPPGGL